MAINELDPTARGSEHDFSQFRRSQGPPDKPPIELSPRKDREPIGIFEETQPLKSVAIWGPPGSEAVLAGLFPPYISLFHDRMLVPVARGEIMGQREKDPESGFVFDLRQAGVHVTQVRSELARLLDKATGVSDLTYDGVLQELYGRADEIMGQNHAFDLPKSIPTQILVGKEEKPKFETDIRSIIHRVKSDLRHLLELDIDLYGERAALILNKALSLDEVLPLGNSLYARDQMNVLLGRRIRSNMAEPIRRGEIKYYEQVYREVLELDDPIIIPEKETFEGGDAYVHNGTVYIGVGFRTSRGAAMHIFEQLSPQLEELGMEFVIVENKKATMDFMHLDTFSMPIGLKQIVVCKEEAERRRVFKIEKNGGSINIVDTGQTFVNFLESQGDEVIPLSLREQDNFGANFLVIDENTIFVPTADNQEVITALEAAGKKVINVDLDECTKGYGAVHCMTGQLVRAK